MMTHRLQTILLLSVVGGVILTASAFSTGGANSGACSATGSSATNQLPVDPVLAGNSDAIQRAIDSAAASGGGIVQLARGQYDIQRPLVLKNNVALRGSGPETVLKASSRFLDIKGPHGGHPLVTTDGAVKVTIANLTADQSGDVLNGNVEGRLNEYLIDVRHSVNALVEGVTTKNPFTYSIAVVGSSNFCVRDSSTVSESTGMYDQLDGIHVTDSHGGVVVGNRVDQRKGQDGDDGLVAQTMGAEVYDVVYRNNDVRGGSHGASMQLAVSGHEIHHITIDNNRFWGSPSGVRTGYYDGQTQAVHDVTIKGNSFSDLDGASADIVGQLENIQILDNRICRSGEFHVQKAPKNVIAGNVTSCEL
ncbi:right-handed parallel beta-helix repeat-containing protein [Pseudarthrobacter sp. TAF60_1]|uniref:right-handed parallel beta-helix repeat-containing protein n=1 Tax=Pseudarthrobacter sp. TAF60_1 TaxID=3233071 RepID=UPI003F96A08E